MFIEGSRVITSTNSIQGQINAYNYCPPVASIVNRKAKATLNGKWYLLNQDGSEAKGATANEINKLLTKPNMLQSWKQFLLQAKIFEQIFGEVFIFALRPAGMKSIKSLWVIPNWLITIKPGTLSVSATEISEIVKGYTMTLGGKTTDVSVNDIFHYKDLPVNSADYFHGQSRLIALQDPVSNIVAAYESRNVLITKRGAIGILGNETKDAVGSVPLKPDEKQQLQSDFANYGITKDKYQVIISASNLKWQSMTFPTKDLMLFEEIEDDVRQIADNYEYPMHLLGFKAGTTFNNFNEAKKSLYQDTIIPETEMFAEGLNEFLGLNNQAFKLQVFFDHLETLQKSQADKAAVLKTTNEAMKVAFDSGIVTMEEWRESIDYDPTKFNGNTFYNGNTNNPPVSKSGLV
jgi:HK97 family phage portal protein